MDIDRCFAVYYQVILAKRLIVNERTLCKEAFSKFQHDDQLWLNLVVKTTWFT